MAQNLCFLLLDLVYSQSVNTLWQKCFNILYPNVLCVFYFNFMPKSIVNYNLTRKQDCNGYDLPALLLNCNVVGWLYSVTTICLCHFQSHYKNQEINF